MDATLVTALLAAAGAALASRSSSGHGQLSFIRDNWGDIARVLRERGTPEPQIERFHRELSAAL